MRMRAANTIGAASDKLMGIPRVISKQYPRNAIMDIMNEPAMSQMPLEETP
jgi:hypothetical protein